MPKIIDFFHLQCFDSGVFPTCLDAVFSTDYHSGVLPDCHGASYDLLFDLEFDSRVLPARCTYLISTEDDDACGDSCSRVNIDDLRFALRGGGKSKDRKKLTALKRVDENQKAEEFALTEGSEIDTSLLEPSWIHDDEAGQQTFEEAPEPAGVLSFPSICSGAWGAEQQQFIGKAEKSPQKKKAKTTKLRGGMAGPDNTGSRTVELGGSGDCGWRTLAFQLMRMNLQGDLREERMRQIPSRAKALKAQANHYLKTTNTTWQATWTADSK